MCNAAAKTLSVFSDSFSDLEMEIINLQIYIYY
jgi:hypothetical protein